MCKSRGIADHLFFTCVLASKRHEELAISCSYRDIRNVDCDDSSEGGGRLEDFGKRALI